MGAGNTRIRRARVFKKVVECFSFYIIVLVSSRASADTPQAMGRRASESLAPCRAVDSGVAIVAREDDTPRSLARVHSVSAAALVKVNCQQWPVLNLAAEVTAGCLEGRELPSC